MAVEAQACGLPVVARACGGAVDTVKPGESGVFFEEASAESLLAGIERATATPAEVWEPACRENAERFGEAAFDEAIRGWIASPVVRSGR